MNVVRYNLVSKTIVSECVYDADNHYVHMVLAYNEINPCLVEITLTSSSDEHENEVTISLNSNGLKKVVEALTEHLSKFGD